MHGDTMDLFHPLIRDWFEEQIGDPTDIQAKAWPHIANGEHVLITAPTGSGKTLTAFLWALNRLITGDQPTGRVGVLYVSPLKALNNDIQRNLLGPLRQLRHAFARERRPFPDINVSTRSGDTPQADRRRMVRHPPEILITTPESLNLLLASAAGRSLLPEITTVILDEIHAVFGSKRGTHLITAVDRLVLLCGEFQRIALSATVRPLETVAQFVGGYRLDGVEQYTPRPVSIVRAKTSKRYDLRIRYPDEPPDSAESVWDPVVEAVRKILDRNRSTLIFVNGRRLCERLAHMINTDAGGLIAYAHHGSLSRDIRETVEGKLKAGELKAIVATSTLEMGIDIGALDEVILIQSPFSI
ncbi:ATP-dependent helicase, partial [Candidatus Poribacteria bacterium]|nr:ATP-dependent helicase [Candidatus Poribacteria bacterium]